MGQVNGKMVRLETCESCFYRVLSSTLLSEDGPPDADWKRRCDVSSPDADHVLGALLMDGWRAERVNMM